MRVKFLGYINIKEINTARFIKKREVRMVKSNETRIYPLAHCICGKNYFPLDSVGNFQEF